MNYRGLFKASGLICDCPWHVLYSTSCRWCRWAEMERGRRLAAETLRRIDKECTR